MISQVPTTTSSEVAALTFKHIQQRDGRWWVVNLGARLRTFQMPTWVKELIALDEALTNLAAADPRKAQVVELRYFGGLSVKETAAVLKVSEDTVARDWRTARAWLLSELD